MRVFRSLKMIFGFGESSKASSEEDPPARPAYTSPALSSASSSDSRLQKAEFVFDARRKKIRTYKNAGPEYNRNADIASTILHNMTGLYKCKFEYEPGVMLKIDIKRDKTDMEIDFECDLETSLATHGTWKINKASQQGKGIGKQIMANRWALYRAFGIKKVKSTFAWVGPYAFARYGFIPTEDDWKQNVKPKVSTRFNEISKAQEMPAHVRRTVKNALSSKNPARIWDIADLRFPVDGKPLGFRLLHENSWDGEFDMDNQKQMARIKKYVGEKTMRESFSIAAKLGRTTKDGQTENGIREGGRDRRSPPYAAWCSATV